MQIKGEEFIRKVQLQQEREELERKLNELEEVETEIKQESTIPTREEIPVQHELDNIMLEVNETNNEDNKKKYLVLGVVLVVLFLLTIIIIRLLTDDSEKDNSFSSAQPNSMEMKKIEENANIEENFQKIINERIKKENESQVVNQVSPTEQQPISPEPQTQVQSTVSNEEPVSNNLDETMRKIEEKIDQKVEESRVIETVKEEPKKVETKKPVTQSATVSSSNDVINGYFIQIGAFTKTPSASYINKIRDAGLKYKIYKVEVKGTLYNKVLIGPYSSRGAANENIEDIKAKLNLASAYILKF